MSNHMDSVVAAAEGEPTAGKAAATIINGLAALVANAGTDADQLRTAVREIRREAGTLEELVDRKVDDAVKAKLAEPAQT